MRHRQPPDRAVPTLQQRCPRRHRDRQPGGQPTTIQTTSELEDFGDAALVADNGATNYFRVDWFTPDGLGAWGDGRTFIILGTEGYIELRKYLRCRSRRGVRSALLGRRQGRTAYPHARHCGFPPSSGNSSSTSLERTERAMTQEHTFKRRPSFAWWRSETRSAWPRARQCWLQRSAYWYLYPAPTTSPLWVVLLATQPQDA